MKAFLVAYISLFIQVFALSPVGSIISTTVYDSDIGFTDKQKQENSEFSSYEDTKFGTTYKFELADKIDTSLFNRGVAQLSDNKVFLVKATSGNTSKQTLYFYSKKFALMHSSEQNEEIVSLKNSEGFKELSSKDSSKLTSLIVKNSELSQEYVIGIITGDIAPDYSGSYGILVEWQKIVLIICVVIGVVLIVFFIATLILDLCYLTLPVDEDKDYKFVSKCAKRTLKSSLTTDRKNTMLLFFKNRLITYLVLGVLIVLCISGKMFSLIVMIYNLIASY